MLSNGDISQVHLPKTERGERTFLKIIESAEKMFLDKGYHGTGIKDITDEAGVGLGTFYLYFQDNKHYHLYKAYSTLYHQSF